MDWTQTTIQYSDDEVNKLHLIEASAKKECNIMPIDRLIDYLESGWVIYDVSNKRDKEIKYLALVNLNQVE